MLGTRLLFTLFFLAACGPADDPYSPPLPDQTEQVAETTTTTTTTTTTEEPTPACLEDQDAVEVTSWICVEGMT